MLRTSKRSLQRFRSEYGLRYQKISRAGVYQPEHGRGDAGRQKGAESEGRNGKESSGQNGEGGKKEAEGIPGLTNARETEAKRETGSGW